MELRITPTIKNSIHEYLIGKFPIVDRIRKLPCDHPMVAKNNAMNPTKQCQRIDLRKQSIQEVVSYSIALFGVKLLSLCKIIKS